jgi:hypothetical protein
LARKEGDVNTNLWILTALAVVLVTGSGISYRLGINYVPAILMFVATLLVLGITMSLEDVLLAKYDTPHDDDTHLPKLVALRSMRAIIVIAMGIMIFVVAF